MKTKFFAMFFAVAILCISMASAVNLQMTSLEVNSHSLLNSRDSSTNYDYARGDKLNLYVCVEALADVKDAQVYADISGYQYANEEPDKIHAMTDTFDLLENHEDCFDLNLEVPLLIEKDYFKLRIRADDRNGTSVDETYQLYLKGVSAKSAIQIKDYSLDPQEVIAGRAFTGKVQVHNYGTSSIKDLKLTMSIPELNIKVSEYMDEINADKSKTFEELLLRIPECTKAGTYDVEFAVDFDNFRKSTTTGTITVLSSDTCGTAATGSSGNIQQNTVVTVPNIQETAQGTSVVYPIVIANNGATSQTYTLSVTGTSAWSTTRIDPSAVLVVPAGQTKTTYLYVSSNDNAELGDKTFTLSIDSGSETKVVPLIAKITKSTTSDWTGFKKALEVGLIVLVVILIIVGLIIGFNKMKENKQEAEPYY